MLAPSSIVSFERYQGSTIPVPFRPEIRLFFHVVALPIPWSIISALAGGGNDQGYQNPVA